MVGYIYKITNIINNKIYIGQTIKSVKHRWNQHKRNARYSIENKVYDHHLARAILKYGTDSFIVETIEDIIADNRKLLADTLNEKETYYIEFYNSFYNGYNSTLGGAGTRGTIESLSGQSKPIIQYDLDGNKIGEWPCLAKAAREIGLAEDSIRKIANGYKKYCHKLECTWRWKDDPKKLPIIVDVNRVLQYDLNHKLIKIWNSYSTICREMGEPYAKNVSRVCLGNRNTFNGYIWEYQKRV